MQVRLFVPSKRKAGRLCQAPSQGLRLAAPVLNGAQPCRLCAANNADVQPAIGIFVRSITSYPSIAVLSRSRGICDRSPGLQQTETRLSPRHPGCPCLNCSRGASTCLSRHCRQRSSHPRRSWRTDHLCIQCKRLRSRQPVQRPGGLRTTCDAATATGTIA